MNKIKQVNASGLKLIKQILRRNHKKGIFTDNEVLAWADEVESNIENHGSQHFEIPSWDSVTGAPKVFNLPNDCIEEVEAV